MINLVEQLNQEKLFTPFTITLALNTIEDAQAVYFLFNYLPIIEGVLALDEYSAAKIRDHLCKTNPDLHLHEDSFHRLKKELAAKMNRYAMDPNLNYP